MSAGCKVLFLCCAAAFGLMSSAMAEEPAKVNVNEPVKVVDEGADDPEDPVELFALAEKEMARQDLKVALRLLLKAANENYTPAQVRLGEYLDYSEYDEDAVGWFMTAAFQGNTKGAFGLAKMYAAGEGVEKNEGKAFFWFKFAAEKDHIGAIKVIANAYKTGLLGQEVNLQQAKLWEDKLPALEAAKLREELKEREEVKKKLLEKRQKEINEKIEKADEREKFLEEKALERAAAKKAAADKAAEGGD